MKLRSVVMFASGSVFTLALVTQCTPPHVPNAVAATKVQSFTAACALDIDLPHGTTGGNPARHRWAAVDVPGLDPANPPLVTATLCDSKCTDLFHNELVDCPASFGDDPLISNFDDNTAAYLQCDGGPCANWVPTSTCATARPVFAKDRILVQCGSGSLFPDQTDGGRPPSFFGREYESVHVTVAQ